MPSDLSLLRRSSRNPIAAGPAGRTPRAVQAATLNISPYSRRQQRARVFLAVDAGAHFGGGDVPRRGVQVVDATAWAVAEFRGARQAMEPGWWRCRPLGCAAGEHQQVAKPRQLVRPVPCVDAGERIVAEQPHQRLAAGQFGQRRNGVRRAPSGRFASRGFKDGNAVSARSRSTMWRCVRACSRPALVGVLHRQPQHGQAIRRACPRRCAMPRPRGEEQGHPRCAERAAGGNCRVQVAEVNGIECAAENGSHLRDR